MNCTAPCIPPCSAEATHEIKTMTGSHLGMNCAQHSKFCAANNVNTGKADYAVTPLEPVAP